MIIKDYRDVVAEDVEGVPGVTIRWVIAEDDGAPYFALRVFEVQPGCATLHHSHWWEHEVFILAGEGVVQHGEGETAVHPGTTILVPGGEMHCFRNTGSDMLRFICLIPHPWLEGVGATHSQ